MCIAILNKKGTLSEKSLRNCWENNPDGGGLLYAVKGKMWFFKTLNVEELILNYNGIRKDNPDIPIVLHFRWATHGTKTHENIHPFFVSHKLGFVHNGVLRNVIEYVKDKEGNKDDMVERQTEYGTTYYARKEETRSDTAMFCELLQSLPAGFIYNPTMVHLIEEYIGAGSKLIFLDHEGRYQILGEEKGVWREDNWYSNLGFMDKEEINEIIRKSKKKNKKKWKQAQIGFAYQKDEKPHGIPQRLLNEYKEDNSIVDDDWALTQGCAPCRLNPENDRDKVEEEEEEGDDFMNDEYLNCPTHKKKYQDHCLHCVEIKTFLDEMKAEEAKGESNETCDYCFKYLDTPGERVNRACNKCVEFYAGGGVME